MEAHLSRCPLAADILELCEPAAAEGRGNGPLPISAEEEKVHPGHRGDRPFSRNVPKSFKDPWKTSLALFGQHSKQQLLLLKVDFYHEHVDLQS